MEEIFYIYRHIRLDTNEPFYIGLGKVYRQSAKNHKDYYSRAFQKTKRNRFWNFIIEKSEFSVEIIFETNSRKKAIEKEIEFIALYGRRDLGKGTLVNLTDGGDGMNNNIQSEKTIKRRSELYYAGKTALKPLIGKYSPVAKKVIEIETGKIFDSCTEGAKYIGIRLSNFLDQLSNTDRENKTGFKYLEESLNKEYICRKRDVKVYDYSTGEIIKNISEASKRYNKSHKSIRGYLDGKYSNPTPLVYYEDYLKGIMPQDLYTTKKTTVKVRNNITGEIYNSLREASRASGINRSTLEAKLKGRLKNDTYLERMNN